jgi:TfoX/Sxy family transcriptional regulator of competence genes
MATDREYLEYVKEQLSEVEGVSFRPMMGEYILYTGGKVAGGIYDNRLLVKPTASAKALMPDAPYELPYEGAKEMLLVDDLDDRQFLRELLTAMYEELPEKKKK